MRLGSCAAFVALVLSPLVASEARADETLTLGRAVELGRQRAPEIKLARAKVASAEAQISTARSGYFPTLSGTVTGQEAALRDTLPPNPPRDVPFKFVTYTTSGTGALSIRWTVLDFGRTSNAVDSAEAGHAGATASAVDSEASFVLDVVNAYFTVLYDERIRDIATSVVQQRERLVTITRGLVKQGLQPAVEELRTAARIESSRRDLEVAEAALRDARAALAMLLGLDPTRSLTLSTPHLARLATDPARAARDAEDKRPTILAARANVTSQQAALAAARSRYYPTLSLNGDGLYRVSRIDTATGLVQTGSVIGAVVLSIPILDASISGRVDSAHADVASAEALLEQARRDARGEAVRAVVAMDGNERAFDHAKKAAEGAAAVLAVIQARYAQGLSGPLDLIEAEASDASARTAQVQAGFAFEGAVVRVLYATGQLLRVAEAR
jgi:outer membrane protein TolC